jgi:hypothetical protein
MLRGKRLINLQVTVGAGGLIERAGIAFDMTILANESCAVCFGLMRPQRKRGDVVIKTGGSPIIWRVTIAAPISKRSRVRIIFGMTRDTVHRRAFEDRIFMAVLASHTGVPALQLERKLCVIYRPVPSIGSMAGGALGTERAIMFIVLFVARKTICWNALVNIILMAQRASHIDMQTCQLEVRQIMIELSGFLPAFSGVTNSAFVSKLTCVRVIFFMARKTILRGSLQVREVARINMTFRTCGDRMDSHQTKRNLSMVKTLAM